MLLQAVERQAGEAVGAVPRVSYARARDTGHLRSEGEVLTEDTLCFELVEHAAPDALLAAPIELDPGDAHLLRCDRVDFPPGGVARPHTHAGPGIRVLLHGTIRIEMGGTSVERGPGDAWFEPGPEPVLATTTSDGPSAFVRCLVLPRRLLGLSSIAYVHPEDAARPKDQRYTVFVDAPIALPVAP